MALQEKVNDLVAAGIQEVSFPVNQISTPGQVAIQAYLRSHVGVILPVDFSWEWETKDPVYGVQGNFSKRVRAYLKKNMGVALSDEHVALLGNLAAKNTEDRDRYLVDFDRELNWKPGDFGDGGSCFWGSNATARKILRVHQAAAIRFYKHGPSNNALTRFVSDQLTASAEIYLACACQACQEARDAILSERDRLLEALDSGPGSLCGFGRAWIALDWPNSGQAVVFNAYPQNTFKLERVARVAARILGLEHYQPIKLSNFGEIRSTLFINSGSGYLLGPLAEIQNVSELDFHWNTTPPQTCSLCGELRQGCRQTRFWHAGAPQNGLACPACLETLCTCDECGIFILETDATPFRRCINHEHGRGGFVCPACAAGVAPCPLCGESTLARDDHQLKALQEGRWACFECCQVGELNHERPR